MEVQTAALCSHPLFKQHSTHANEIICRSEHPPHPSDANYLVESKNNPQQSENSLRDNFDGVIRQEDFKVSQTEPIILVPNANSAKEIGELLQDTVETIKKKLGQSEQMKVKAAADNNQADDEDEYDSDNLH
eukprot:TRINITY_DN5050_c0_g1_i3.p1 TRINITY_DN5050_c0_g1~~TRINITY_DN5050_c0_g1_i3.p1  ORF type:complete len:132 (+),score=27.49 TRINITY_DN5050_c0_g1_i3:410-805(+)